MTNQRFYTAMAVAFCVAASVAQAQTVREGDAGGTADDSLKEPMSIEDSRTEVPATGEPDNIDDQPQIADDDSGEFWFWPCPAPLTGKIATDRPAFSNSASLVPRGRVQLEGGYTFTYDRENDVRIYDHQLGELSLRTGLTDWLEFRLGWTGASITEYTERITTLAGRHVTRERHDDGWKDTRWGIKVPLLREKENCPNVSFIYDMTMPTGNGSKSANDVDHFFGLPWNYAITRKLVAYGSFAGAVLNTPDGQFFQGSTTIAGAFHATDWMTLYAEYFGRFPGGAHQDCAHMISAGPIFWLTDNLSLDARVTVGLNEQAPDFQTSVGFGIRF